MLFTWDYRNTCVIFEWWHIRSFNSFILSLIALVIISAGYEFIKSAIELWEKSHSNTLTGATVNSSAVAIRQYKLKHSLLYGFQVGYALLLMLVFMTYNGWIMIAVAVGAAIGNYFWGGLGRDSTRSIACH
ncbi:copper transpport protein [Suhomyces tanzawaensis NRRL Y-17324]|uniref:Copper transport protein n=1 Tax=Suhomyces tanzawaensis NRRL Y-17324 TaxID=984487 RepID=A0A1E4SN96_9ASCO|nr:copper transpport protein [Suhomyces tanzawaensis NRRL Y-17324]ODV80983.1 copper transpport protein [Suhomyces tanzawaensis NRRL Y-17324]